MSFSSVLKTIGKDLQDVGKWIDAGLKIAEPIIGIIDPPLGAIITEVENVIGSLAVNKTLTAAQVQAMVQAITTLESIKSLAPSTTTATTATTVVTS